MGDRGVNIVARAGPGDKRLVREVVFERRLAVGPVAVGEVAAVVRQLDGPRIVAGSFSRGAIRTTAAQMRDVDVIGIIGEEPGASLEQLRDRRPFRRQRLAAVGDFGPEVGDEVFMKPAHQAVSGGHPVGFVGSQMLERGDRGTGAVLLEDQLEPPRGLAPWLKATSMMAPIRSSSSAGT